MRCRDVRPIESAGINSEMISIESGSNIIGIIKVWGRNLCKPGIIEISFTLSNQNKEASKYMVCQHVDI